MKITRDLKTKDIFTMSRIIKKLGINIEATEKIQTIINGEQTDTVVQKDSRQIGAELILQIISNASQAEEEVNNFFASLLGITAEDFSNLSLTELSETIKEFQNIPGIADFFKKADQLMK